MSYICFGCVVVEPVFVHNPVGFLSMRSSAFVKDESLPHADPSAAARNRLVPSGGLPEPDSRRAVGASSGRVLLVLVAEKVPIVLRGGSDSTLFCQEKREGKKKIVKLQHDFYLNEIEKL